MKLYILPLLLLCFLSILSATNVPAGSVEGTWTLEGSPYNVLGNVSVAATKSLLIEPGVEIFFNSDSGLSIYGRIVAIGTESNPIKFDAINPNWGWLGIRMDLNPTARDSSYFVYTNIQNANGTGLSMNYSRKLRISNCHFVNNNFCAAFSLAGGGLSATRCEGVIENCIFDNNIGGSGGGAYIGVSKLRLLNNVFTHNYSDNGGALVIHQSTVMMKNNKIVNNYAQSYGGGIALSQTDGICEFNTIQGNISSFMGGGVSLTESSTLLSNNVIVENEAQESGGGIYIYGHKYTTPVFLNCLIYKNKADYGGGINIDRSSPELINTTVYGNIVSVGGPQVYINYEGYSPIFRSCNIQDGVNGFSGDGSGEFYDLSNYTQCIDVEPQFIGIGPYSYMPRNGSPVINLGTNNLPDGVILPTSDIAGNPRTFGNAIDIGPYEWQGIEFDFNVIQNGNLVTFTTSCNQEILDIHWDFDMDGIIDSDDPNPTHYYNTMGNYDVGCYVNGGIGGMVKKSCVQVLTANEDAIQPLQSMTLEVYPNPFTNSLQIRTEGMSNKDSKLSIYDVKGRLVQEFSQVKNTDTIWNGCDKDGNRVANGVYFIRFQNGSNNSIKKIVKLK